MYLDKLLKDQR